MISKLVLVIAVLCIIYTAIIWGLIAVLRKVGVPGRLATLVSLLAFGVGMGLAAAWLWPLDTAAVVNMPASLLGDRLYVWTIALFGDPHSPQAHYTTPWIFRVPQVYVLASVLIWGTFGLIIQLIHNHWSRISSCIRGHHSRGLAGDLD